jgi:hypothetical protein
MTTMLLPPPVVAARDVDTALRAQGHATVSPAGFAELIGAAPTELAALEPSWNDLAADAYLRDGGRYRRRRHACFVVDGGNAVLAPRRPHWQPLEYNALHGGLERWFEPITPDVLAQPVWNRLLVGLAAHCSALRGAQPWYVEAHQFRIDTEGGIGRPTPEGAHRDGVDFVAVTMIGRRGVKGGETRVFEADGPNGQRFTMSEPWTTVLLDDARVIHETTPIQPLQPGSGYRDTLVVTYRAGGFQGPG